MNPNEVKIREIVKNVLLVLTIIGFLYSLYYSFTNLTSPKSVNVFIVLPFIFFLVPYLALNLFEVKKVEAKMQVIPRFLRDIVDNVESGMDLISSIKSTTKNEYTVLNEDIKRLTNQLSWGVSFDKAMLNFGENVGSDTLKRDVQLVIEARRVGGHVEKILREVSQKINIDNLRTKERRSNLASNTFTGYISFIIFIFIIILVYNNLFVGLVGSFETGIQSELDPTGSNETLSTYLTLFTLLAYELSILSGFLFGLMQDNSVIAGAPHVVILVLITFVGFFFFI